MKLQSPFTAVTSSLDGDVLAVLAPTDEWFTVSRIHRLLGGRSREGIRRALHRLTDAGTVDARTLGRETVYCLNRDHLAAPAIVALSQLRRAFIERLAQEMRTWPAPPAYAALFGSAARGEQREDSDVDLFVARPRRTDIEWDDRLENLVAQASRWIGADVRPFVLEMAELHRAAAHEPIVRSIVEEGVPVFGDAGEFRRLVSAP